MLERGNASKVEVVTVPYSDEEKSLIRHKMYDAWTRGNNTLERESTTQLKYAMDCFEEACEIRNFNPDPTLNP